MEYARKVGFDIRMTMTKDVDDVLSQCRMVCSKQRYYSPVGKPKRKRRIRNSRCGYDAMIYLVLDSSMSVRCFVSFVEEHNHGLVNPNKRWYLQVNQVITSLSRALFQSLSSSNIFSSDQYSVSAHDSWMSFTSSDFLNMMRDQRMLEKDRNADLLLERFEELKSEDPMFFHKALKHDDGKFLVLVVLEIG